MNLYRNFGNLLESWVSEGCPDLEFESGACVDGLDGVSRESIPVFIVKSESEDSGVETVSTTSPCHSHQCSGLTSDDSNPVFGSTEDDVQPPSLSPSVCSSSSSCVSLGSVAPRTSCVKVEEALRRTDVSGSDGPQYQCNMASFPTNCHLTNSRPYDRFVRPRRTHSQPSDLKKAELYRKHCKSHLGGRTVHLECADGDQSRLDRLSPGLLYLEQVCRMLENMAKLQQQNHSLQEEVEILKSQHAEIEVLSLHKEEISYPTSESLQILCHEEPTSGSTSLKESVGFRHRSFTDTQTAIGHYRRTRFARDKNIADVIDEEPDGKDPLPENECKKLSKIQKLKFISFRRQETQKPDIESKSFDPIKKTRVPGIFRRRMTTRL